MAEQRLDKIISDSGVATRSEAKALIKARAVTIDGEPALSPERKLDPEAHIIVCSGKLLNTKRFRSFMLYKPVGVISATEDREQKTVLDLLPKELRQLGLFPVGRLDKDTTGLLILTNDGELSHRVTSPRHEVVKRYELKTDGALEEKDAAALAAGLELRDGTKCKPAILEIDPSDKNRASILITEGKYHQVRRMMAAVGKPVLELKRCSEGGLNLDEKLRPGEYRELSDEELELLFTN